MKQMLDRAARILEDAERVTIISHADADGICATAILQEALKLRRTPVRTVFLPQISGLAIDRLLPKGLAVFLDCGASHLRRIRAAFPDALIIDHHTIDGEADERVINPLLAELDGTREVSAAGLAYEVARRLTPDYHRLAPLALIGAQADHQEPFVGMNAHILDEARTLGLVLIRTGARLFGIHSRPLVQLIAKSYDLQLPDLQRYDAVERFLSDLGIPSRAGSRPRMFSDLSPEERDLLERELIKRSPNTQARITHYTLPGMSPGALQDTREAATIINACGRLGEPELAVRALLGDPAAARDAADAQRSYGNLLREAHEWYLRARETGDPDVRVRDGIVIMDARDRMPPDLTGALCSMLVRGAGVPPGTIVVCLARNRDGTTKVSSRTSGTQDLAALMAAAAGAVGGEGGGHSVAAGAMIPTEQEGAFIDAILSSERA